MINIIYNKTIFSFTISFVIILITALQVSAQNNIDLDITAAMQREHLPGVAAAIIKNGEVVWDNCYGYADIDNNIAVSDSTLFMIASISKTIVGVSLMQQWEKSKFQLDDDINNYLDFSVRNHNHPNDPLTFRMLLTHTSSITGDYYIPNLNLPEFTWGYDHPISIGEFLKGFFTPGGEFYQLNNFRSFKPGENYDYSSIGATLIAYLVERLSGESFDDYCQKNIFEPLEMNETSYFLSNIDQRKLAVPYKYQNGSYVGYPHRGTPLYPCGWIKTDVIQLSNYLIALMQKGISKNNRILQPETVDLMTTAQSSNFRFGFMIYEISDDSRVMWGHDGSSLGVSTLMYFCPDENSGVILLSNGETNQLPYLALELFDFTQSPSPVYDESVPAGFDLEQNYPNPFNPGTTIEFSIPAETFVKLKVYDLLGREIASLAENYFSAGSHSVKWNASGMNSGIYFYTLETDDFVRTRKLILLK